MMEAVLFYIFAIGVLAAGAQVVLRRNPIYGALSLVGCFFFLAGIIAVVATTGVIAWRALGAAYPQGPHVDNALRISGFGTVREVGRILYLSSVLPFEVTSLLLLVAVVAAVVVAKGKI